VLYNSDGPVIRNLTDREFITQPQSSRLQ